MQRPNPSGEAGQRPQLLQQRLQGAFLTIIGLAGLVGGVLFSIEAPRFTPVPVVFLTFWLVMVIVGRILFTGLNKLREAGVGAPAPQQVRAAAAVAGIVVAVGMMGFAATTTGSGVAAAAPCPGGGPATCGPTGPELTFAPPTGQATAPGQQPGQQGGQDQQGIATSPAKGGDNGPGIQAQTPEFGTPGQQAPNIPGNEQPGQGGQQQPAQGQQTGQQNPVRTTAPGRPDQTGQQQTSQATQSGQPSQSTVTVTQTQSQCPAPGAAGSGGAPGGGNGGPGAPGTEGGSGPDNGGESKDGAPSWSYLVAEATGVMAGRKRGGTTGGAGSPLAGPATPSPTTSDVQPSQPLSGLVSQRSDGYQEWTTADGRQTLILEEGAGSPSKYRFQLPVPQGGRASVNPDGSVSITDSAGRVVNTVNKPWAYDMAGRDVPTYFTLDGNELIQHINRPVGDDLPILADPSYTNPPDPAGGVGAWIPAGEGIYEPDGTLRGWANFQGWATKIDPRYGYGVPVSPDLRSGGVLKFDGHGYSPSQGTEIYSDAKLGYANALRAALDRMSANGGDYPIAPGSKSGGSINKLINSILQQQEALSQNGVDTTQDGPIQHIIITSEEDVPDLIRQFFKDHKYLDEEQLDPVRIMHAPDFTEEFPDYTPNPPNEAVEGAVSEGAQVATEAATQATSEAGETGAQAASTAASSAADTAASGTGSAVSTGTQAATEAAETATQAGTQATSQAASTGASEATEAPAAASQATEAAAATADPNTLEGVNAIRAANGMPALTAEEFTPPSQAGINGTGQSLQGIPMSEMPSAPTSADGTPDWGKADWSKVPQAQRPFDPEEPFKYMPPNEAADVIGAANRGRANLMRLGIAEASAEEAAEGEEAE
ncbi:hypothetical protein FK268_17475 [Tsukamurella sputi]|uniref:Uncharacterized protein n=1 Tax=Tsukamurella sputi TaxID=2591848 RepID=A0A5C5RIE0_9ACTN|nr:hypothetical protein [Tsukamurella sputi]TWS22799.1 hypothetical protein FK268_17475 [Tsukamurella sputi]